MAQGCLASNRFACDVCTKLIAPAIERAGWDIQSQVREEVSLTAGRVMVRGRLVARGTAKRADYVLYLKPNLPLAVIEAKEPSHRVGDGMQQALEYADMLGVPFAFSSNGSEGWRVHARAHQLRGGDDDRIGLLCQTGRSAR